MEIQSFIGRDDSEGLSPVNEYSYEDGSEHDAEGGHGEGGNTEDDNQYESVACSGNTGQKRKRVSSVWGPKAMEKVTRLDKDGKPYPYAVCFTCRKEFPACTKRNGTSNLLNHLKKCKGSPLYIEEPDQALLTQDSLGSTLLPHRFDQDRLDRRCVEWVIAAEMSFRSVDHPKFREFIADLCPKYRIPNRKTIAKGVWSMYVARKEELKKGLGDVRVSITTDTWTSIRNINYMVVTAHFIDSAWVLHKRIISFVKITSHKGEELGKTLSNCMDDWGIEKIFSITVDNATANDGLINYMHQRLESQGTLLLNGIYLHMRCACHIINLIVKEGMEELVHSIEGIRNCVKYIHSSPARLNAFRKFAVKEKMDAMATIPLDVATRWNATFKMLNSAQTYKKVFTRMSLDDHSFRNYFLDKEGPPSEDDWKKSVSFATFLEKFYDATNEMSATKTPTSHLILTTVLTMQKDILEVLQTDDADPVMMSVAESMHEKLKRYWGAIADTSPLMFVAQVLDPVLKMDMIKILFEGIDSSEELIEDTKKKVKKYLHQLYTEYNRSGSSQPSQFQHQDFVGTTSSGPNSASSSSSGGISGGHSAVKLAYMLLLKEREAAHGIEIINEVDKYFNDPCECVTVDFDLLAWWKVNSGRYPVLSKIARDVFAVPSSSVASESAFSLGERVVDPFRASLTPKTVEALVCTADWLRGGEFSFVKEPTDAEVELYHELEEIENEMEITSALSTSHVEQDIHVPPPSSSQPEPVADIPSATTPSPTPTPTQTQPVARPPRYPQRARGQGPTQGQGQGQGQVPRGQVAASRGRGGHMQRSKRGRG